jgi:voltage-gated potassium channel Kch
VTQEPTKLRPRPAPPTAAGPRPTPTAHQAEEVRHLARQIELPPRTSWWRTWSWLVLAVALVSGFVLAAVYGHDSIHRALIDAFGLFPGFPGYGSDPWQLVLAKHLVALVTVLVTGRVVFALLGDRIAELRARRLSGHAVICGLGDTGLRSARAFRAAGYRVTCLDLEHKTRTGVDARAAGAFVLQRDATQVSSLQDARVEHAAFVVCTCPDDATNTKIASLVVALVARAGSDRAPSIHVEIANPDLARLLRAPLASVGASRLHFFDSSSVWARALLDAGGGPFARLERVPPRIAVLGATNLGTALVVEAARQWHRHARASDVDGRATIVLMDPNAAETCAALVERYPALARVCDLAPVTHPLGTSGPVALTHLGDATPDAAYVCLDDQSLNLALALEAENTLPDDKPVFLPATAAAGALGPLLFGGGRISAVVLPQDASSIDLLHDSMRDLLAREAREAYLAKRRRAPDFGSSDPLWEELDAESRRSNHAHAEAIIEQLRAVWHEVEPLYDWDAPPGELTDEAIDAMAELEHRRWCRDKQAAGWRHAPVRDDDQKCHDLLVSWAELPEDARDINRAMVASRPAILAQAGYRLKTDPARELLARRLHERYVEARAATGESAPRAVPWEDLSERGRDNNRASIDHVAVKVARIGCRIAPQAAGAAGIAFTSEEVEQMAEAEHERWLVERANGGWTLGPRNDEARTHPSLVPWSELPEPERDKDRAVVTAIPPLLAEAGYVIVRTDERLQLVR